MKRYLLIGLASLCFAGSANAQSPEDINAVVNNLPAAVDVLVVGLEDTANTLADTQSAVDTSAAAGDAVVSTGSTLVQGAPTLGALGLGLALSNAGVQGSLNPFLTAIDDPSQENLDNVFNPDDLATIAGNLEPAADATIFGSPFAFNTGLRDAAVGLLEGNLVPGGPLPVGPSATSSTLYGLTAGTDALFADTNYGQGGANFGGTMGIVSLVTLSAAQGPLTDVEDGAAPVFEGAAPVTDPVIDALNDL